MGSVDDIPCVGVLGHREDMVIMDDVTTTDGWFNSCLDGDSIPPGWLTNWVTNNVSPSRVVWGPSEEPERKEVGSLVEEYNNRLGAYLSTPLVFSEYTPKEKEMEIGGSKCHLCGEELLYNGINRTMVKKHRKVESHQVYTCGTSIFTTWRERDCDMGCFDSKRDRHIHAECITNCCS